MLQEGSEILYKLSDKKLVFGPNVDIILPYDWISCGKYSDTILDSSDSAPIKVTGTHPLFGDEIWTQQPRQCGEPGDFTFVPFEWLRKSSQKGKKKL